MPLDTVTIAHAHGWPGPSSTADHVVERMRDYLALPDAGHVYCALAAAVCATDLDGEPCWLLIVGAPSSGKTETLRFLDGIADAHIDEITSAGLLSWLPAKGQRPARPTVLLARHLGVLLATIGDLSTLLASSDRGQRDQLFADLRRAYDGRLVRELGNAPEPLRWEGRLTLLAAVTPEIDNYSSHADALGPRWLYVRLPPLSQDDRRAATRKQRHNGATLSQHRAAVRALAEATVNAARDQFSTLTIGDLLADAIEDAAIVACLGRASVPRDGYGRREIVGLPVIEEPPRLVSQLSKLARGLLALGLDEHTTADLCRRVALDSMPLTRRRILAALADGEPLSIAETARRAGADRTVARRTLEELAAIGITTYVGAATDDADDPREGKRGPWHLSGEDGQLAARVLTSAKGVPKSVTTTHSPQEVRGIPHTSAHPDKTNAQESPQHHTNEGIP